ncbi:unnamed protein product [Closterium sp. NIES-54]
MSKSQPLDHWDKKAYIIPFPPIPLFFPDSHSHSLLICLIVSFGFVQGVEATHLLEGSSSAFSYCRGAFTHMTIG